MRVSRLAQGVKTSPIITLAAEINERIARGEKFYNLTIGDFNSQIFPIPELLKAEITKAYQENQTNYPGAKGLPVLLEAVSELLKMKMDVQYDTNSLLIASGARPLIYAAYLATTDPGDKVIYPVPSWNNDHYTQLSTSIPVFFETSPEQNFMPDAEDLAPLVRDARMIMLCSPLNPTGTVMSKAKLESICDLVLAENHRRSGQRPLYVVFDSIYWQLTFGENKHYNAVQLRPAMREYSIFIDGISKSFAATGVRLGWGFGPVDVMAKMRSIVSHMGAWAPKPEQIGTGKFLKNHAAVDEYMTHICSEIQQRLLGFYNGFKSLKEKGFKVDAIEPQAAIYLTVQMDLKGAKTASGQVLESNAAVHRYILDEAKVGILPFSYFGTSEESNWYRLSVGTCKLEEVEEIMSNLETALGKLSF